jgi:hypothetical protein
MTNADRIIEYLADHRGQAFCDDCLSSSLKIEPRQTVNQTCNKLKNKGRIKRQESICSSCSDFKLANTIGNYQITKKHGTSGPTMSGSAFEDAVKIFLKEVESIDLIDSFSVEVGVGELKKTHKFDLGNDTPPILVECKAHKWTEGGNVPSAKMTIWNEAMYYFAITPAKYRKILFVLRSECKGESLADYYIRMNDHLIPLGVEIWEYESDTKTAKCVYSKEKKTASKLIGNKKTRGTVTAKKCEYCGHHEIGITTDAGEYVPLKAGMKAEINE